MATSLNNLGILYLNQHQYDQAQRYLEQALAIRQAKLGSEHPYTQDTAQALMQAIVIQALEAQRSELEDLLDQNPDLKDQLQAGLRQQLDRDPSPDEILIALIVLMNSGSQDQESV